MPHLPKAPDIAPALPWELPAPDTGPSSSCTILTDGGLGVTLWSSETSRTSPSGAVQVQLQLSPDSPAIIGRKNGGEIEYLDPRYVPTPIMPGTGRTILRHGGSASDNYVSRGHFMLRCHARGIVLVNGVPRRGGGIRPPRNWTELIEPTRRLLAAAEELLIERGTHVTIKLPNDTRLTIQAQ